MRQTQFLSKQFQGRQNALDHIAGSDNMLLSIGQGAQMAFAGDEDILGLVPAGDTQQFLAEQVDTLIGLGGQGNCHAIGLVMPFRLAFGEVDLVVEGDALKIGRQTLENFAVGIRHAAAGIN